MNLSLFNTSQYNISYKRTQNYCLFSSPPRPSPGSVLYADDDNKYPDDNSSTLSDKPSDLSYDDDQESQVSKD